MKSIVVAYSIRDMAIGKEGKLPWEGKLCSDMDHFKNLTMGTSVIMGRTTYESIPERFRPLEGRQNIVLSRSALKIAGVEVAHSLEEAYKMAEYEPMVIGGAKVYKKALPTVDRVYATEVLIDVPGATAYFEGFDSNEWEKASRPVYREKDSKNAYRHCFITYLRKSPIENTAFANVD